MPWYVRLRNVFRTNQVEEALDSEFEFHLAEIVDHLMANGISEKEAGSRPESFDLVPI
jgi:hypothetical protein